MKRRRKMLLFSGVPDPKLAHENTMAIVVDIVTKKMEVADFSESLIAQCNRVGQPLNTNPRPRHLVVRFRNEAIRDTVLNAGTKLQGTGIEVSEFLTKNRLALLCEATRRYGTKACRTQNGVIQIRLPDGSHYTAVSLVELDEITNNYKSTMASSLQPFTAADTIVTGRVDKISNNYDFSTPSSSQPVIESTAADTLFANNVDEISNNYNFSTPSSSQPLIESTVVDTIFTDNVSSENRENNTEMSNVVAVGPKPASIVCPSCRATVVSKVDYDSTTKTHVIALLLCLFLCWPCVCVPYCMESCKNANHYCPNCNSYLGTYMP